ncbi:hypothetical protein [Nocardia brevicatena]|uniref:hypothetical protein n=1 Tax=Nocardia brevicatena TaxID=37327 RepID=UPI0002DAB9FB|nr:hypothetical protein [Nocardia brevicatena]
MDSDSGFQAKDDLYVEVVRLGMPVGFGGIVLAAVMAAMMSTPSGALIHGIVYALTTAYGILAGGLLVAVLGGPVRKGATRAAAPTAIGIGIVATLSTMYAVGDILVDEPAHLGPTTATVGFVAVGLPTPRIPVSALSVWEARTAGQTKAVSPSVSG